MARVGDASIHPTQLACTASLLRRGTPVEETVDTVLEAIRQATDGNPACARWDWVDERIKVEKMCFSLISKNPELSDRLPEGLRRLFEKRLDNGLRPSIGRNRNGWFVRTFTRKGEGGPQEDEAPAEGSSGDQGTAGRKYQFKLVGFADLRPGLEPLYLVDELIPVAGLVDVWGKAKCFKSFWCLDVMLHVAMGWEYRDRYVRAGTVVYCAFEGAHGYKKRIEALRRHYEIEPDTQVPLYVMPGQANLVEDYKKLISDIQSQLDTCPAAVVLDTLNKSLHGSENKPEDMSKYVRAAEAIRDAFKCVVVIVHHCGWDETRPRGHSSLPAAVDAQLAVVKDDKVVTVTVEMMRDGPEDTQVVSEATVVDVDEDQNGKTLTSLVLVPSDATTVPTRARTSRALDVFLTALDEALRRHGRAFYPEPGTLPVMAVEQSHVRAGFDANYAEPEEDREKRQDKIRKAFGRARRRTGARPHRVAVGGRPGYNLEARPWRIGVAYQLG